MRTFRTPALPVLLALALAAAPALLAAQPHGRGGPHGQPGFQRHGEMLGHIFRMLDLEPGQRQSIHIILEGDREAMEALFDRVHTARSRLGDQIHAEVFDEGAIRDAASGLAEAEADLAVARAGMFQEVREILTPEQLDKLAELRAERRQMHGRDHRGPHRQGRFGRPGPGLE